jgi:hypothetical protein
MSTRLLTRGQTDEADTPKSHHLRSVPMADRLAGELERHFQHSGYRADQDLVFAIPSRAGPTTPPRSASVSMRRSSMPASDG